MDENIVYDIKDGNEIINEKSETNESFDINNYILMNEQVNVILSENYSNTENYIDDLPLQHEIFLRNNYTIKMLEEAFEYYHIKKIKGMKKDEMIQLLVLFECEPENSHKVHRRHMLLTYIEELKKDSYFKKFVIF